MSTNNPATTGSARWLEAFDPESGDAEQNKLAWRTLWITTFSLTLAFSTWFLVSAIAPKLQGAGFNLDKNQLYWLTSMPGLSAGILRIIWTFLPPIVGTRRLVSGSTILLLLPLTGWYFALQNPNTPFSVLLGLAFLAGLGGANFSGFMPSTSYFFPKSKQGTALATQAGIGNFGVSLAQLLTPWLISFGVIGSSMVFSKKDPAGKIIATSDVWLHNAPLFFIPLVIIGAFLAWRYLKSVPVKATLLEQRDIFSDKHTYIMTVLYMMTFGTFSGYAAQFGLLIKNQFGGFENAPDPLKFAFLGALVGSVSRIIGGPISDKIGGGILTTISGFGLLGSMLVAATAVMPTSVDQFQLFLWSSLSIFFFAGIGNASTFKQIPMIFPRRQAGGVIGFTAAIGAFGPFIGGVALVLMAPQTFFYIAASFFVVCIFLNYWFYARKNAERHC